MADIDEYLRNSISNMRNADVASSPNYRALIALKHALSKKFDESVVITILDKLDITVSQRALDSAQFPAFIDAMVEMFEKMHWELRKDLGYAYADSLIGLLISGVKIEI